MRKTTTERVTVSPAILRTHLISDGDVLTQKQLEVLLGVGPMTVYLWRKAEDPFPCIKLPTSDKRNRIFFRRDEVEKWLARHKPDRLSKLGGSNGSRPYANYPGYGRVALPRPERDAA